MELSFTRPLGSRKFRRALEIERLASEKLAKVQFRVDHISVSTFVQPVTIDNLTVSAQNLIGSTCGACMGRLWKWPKARGDLAASVERKTELTNFYAVLHVAHRCRRGGERPRQLAQPVEEYVVVYFSQMLPSIAWEFVCSRFGADRNASRSDEFEL
ncbi:hypothetical protein GTC054_27480 [Burkholderia pseudomallei]|nr:hypothetical protein GTC054_27480 [Burkholderia pseudomallei]